MKAIKIYLLILVITLAYPIALKSKAYAIDEKIESNIKRQLAIFKDGLETKNFNKAISPFVKGPTWEGFNHYQEVKANLKEAFDLFKTINLELMDLKFEEGFMGIKSSIIYNISNSSAVTGQSTTKRIKIIALWQEVNGDWKIVISKTINE